MLNEIRPNIAAVGSLAMTITAIGLNFSSSSTLMWNGTAPGNHLREHHYAHGAGANRGPGNCRNRRSNGDDTFSGRRRIGWHYICY